MIRNYFKTAWRNLIRNRASSVINIGGLAIGMAVAIQIGLWIYDELSFNKNFSNYPHIVKVVQNVTNNGEVQTWNTVVDICGGWCRCHHHHFDNGEFPGYQSRGGEPGKKFENGMTTIPPDIINVLC
jgi:putative ABC transport system permease protein